VVFERPKLAAKKTGATKSMNGVVSYGAGAKAEDSR